MTKKILQALPLLIICCFLLYSCITAIAGRAYLTWHSYVALFLFVPVAVLFFVNNKVFVFATGGYLLLGIVGVISFTPAITSLAFGVNTSVGDFWTPSFNLLSFGLFVLFLILQFDEFINWYLDYKERKHEKNKIK